MSERHDNAGGDPRRQSGKKRGRNQTSAGGVVFRRGDAHTLFLLIKDPYQNWGLPKGHIEWHETAAQAAMREVAEETGLTQLRLVDQLATIDWFFRENGHLVHKFCHFFLIESPAGETQPQEDEGITACLWLPSPEAISTISYDNAREVLRHAVNRLEPGSLAPEVP